VAPLANDMRSLDIHSKQLIAAFLAALWLATPLIALSHSRHAHRYCPEHQSLEEAGSVANRQTLEGTATAEVVATGTAVADSHQLCLMVVCERPSLRLGRSSQVALIVLEVGSVLQPKAAVHEPSFAALTRAPKHSPPALS
jgi:hypothetical protein